MNQHFTVSRLARLLDLSDDTIRRRIAAGKLRAVRLSGAANAKFLIPVSEAQQLLTGASVGRGCAEFRPAGLELRG